MNTLLQKASQNLKNKQYLAAINFCKKILKTHPNHPSALFMHAIAQGESGNLNKSLKSFITLIKLHPTNPEVHYNYGLMLQKYNKNDEAITAYKNSLSFDKNNSYCHNNLGNLYYSAKLFSESTEHYKIAFKMQPTNHGFLRNYCKSLSAVKQYNQCISNLHTLSKSTALTIDDINLYINSYQQLGNHHQALVIAENYLDQFSDDFMLLYLAGYCAMKLSRFPIAVKYFLKSIEQNISHINSHMNLAVAYSYLANYSAAEKVLEYIKKLSNDSLETTTFICQLMEMQNELDINDSFFTKAIESFPASSSLLLIKAQCLYNKELYHDSIKTLDCIIHNENDPSLITEANSKLGNAYDRLKQYELAWQAFTKANSTRVILNTTGDFNHKLVSSIKQLNKLSKPSKSYDYNLDFKVIFVVGFPRSGTTLIDSILSCNESSIILEEVPLLDEIANLILATTTFENYYKTLTTLDPEQIQTLQHYYINNVANYRHWNQGQTIIDKSPINIIHTLLMHVLFPDAPIVFALRHPIDACISCYMQNFRSNNELTQCFTSIKSIGLTYNNLMTLWTNVITVSDLNFYYLCYENLVDDFENETKKLIDFVGFNWSNKYLKFYKKTKSRGMIHTPSYNQVNKPIHSNRKFRFLNYSKHVAQLTNKIASWVNYFKY